MDLSAFHELVNKLEHHSRMFWTEAVDLETRERNSGNNAPDPEFLGALREYLEYVYTSRPFNASD